MSDDQPSPEAPEQRRGRRLALTIAAVAVALAAIQVVVNHGYSDDWGDLCWPPARR